MVKKVGGPKPPVIGGSAPIQPAKIEGTHKVQTVQQVESTAAKTGVARARRPTRPMTAEEREHLFKLLNEEADKLFGKDGLPESKRAEVEGAVKMALDASVVEIEDE
jgi:hypothetical protein